MILLIDNYDSFSYNLYQYVGEINPDIKVIRNDVIVVKNLFKNNQKVYVSLAPSFISYFSSPTYLS